MDNEGVRALAPLAQSLTYLSLAQNKLVTDKAWDCLTLFRSLHHLNLSHTGMSVPSIACIENLPVLRELSIHGVIGTQAQADVLAQEFPGLNVSCRELSKSG